MKVEDHIAFTAIHGDWKVGEKLTEMEDEKIAGILARISNTVNERIPVYLRDVMDVEGVMGLAKEFEAMDFQEAVGALKSPGVARKLGAFVFEEDKKLKKLLVDVAKAVLVRGVLGRKVEILYPEGSIRELKVEPPFKEPHINFTAKHGSWIAVRRLILDEKTPMADVARLLAAINESVTAKLPHYAGIDVEGIEEFFGDLKKVKKSEIPKAVERYMQFEPSDYADEPFLPHARIHALRVFLEKLGLPLYVPSKALEKYLEKK
ncbi:MAG: hypothetical protein PWQ79_686 [Thermococcaceae archaeon]|nr:hypothetical protein [Thermococcaceae archaeon]